MKLNIANFKCFENQTIEFKPLTILAGANSVGKSSAIQALLLFRIAIEQLRKNKKSLPINNYYKLALGSVHEVLNRESKTDQIFFSLPSESITLTCDVPKDIDADELILSTNNTKNLLEITNPINHPNFYYLNAERIGPRLDYRIETLPFLHTGYDGAYTIQAFKKLADDIVILERRFDINSSPRYSNQVALWLEYITPGIKVNVPKLYEKARIAEMSFGESAPTNIGFGVSYILPIILTGLLAEKGAMIIIENPEAHLHPSGQSRMGHFLARMSASGVHIVIETHSEHIINGIRIATLSATSKLKSEDIIINFFQKNNNNVAPDLKIIDINLSGDLSSFPRDFFDQTQQDLFTIMQLKRKK
jgi:predicted ATPase